MGTGSIIKHGNVNVLDYRIKLLSEALKSALTAIKNGNQQVDFSISEAKLKELDSLIEQRNKCPKCGLWIYQRKRDGSIICYACGYDSKSVIGNTFTR